MERDNAKRRRSWLGATAVVVVAQRLSGLPTTAARTQSLASVRGFPLEFSSGISVRGSRLGLLLGAPVWPHAIGLDLASVTIHPPQARARTAGKRPALRFGRQCQSAPVPAGEPGRGVMVEASP